MEVRSGCRVNRDVLAIREMEIFSIGAKTKGRTTVSTTREIFLHHERIVGADYSGQKKGSFEALGCTFEDCNFTNMRPQDITFASGTEQTRYVRCRFDGSKFKHLVPGQARFERCSFLNVDISGLFSHAAEFIDCAFSGVLRRSVFYGRVFGNHRTYTPRSVNEFRGNDFSSMKFIDVGFREGIDLALQRLPTGPDYLHLNDAEEKLTALRHKYLQSSPSPLRRAIFEFLEIAEDEVRNGQRDLFLCRDSEASLGREAVDVIWNELSRKAIDGSSDVAP